MRNFRAGHRGDAHTTQRYFGHVKLSVGNMNAFHLNCSPIEPMPRLDFMPQQWAESNAEGVLNPAKNVGSTYMKFGNVLKIDYNLPLDKIEQGGCG
ncbi:MAG: hypothetical protein BroJett018_49840 [Chloroflexota bacterium]|nr:MAG: hypothetical protein BroJett018_49840 [Chloroflexota bacterium]